MSDQNEMYEVKFTKEQYLRFLKSNSEEIKETENMNIMIKIQIAGKFIVALLVSLIGLAIGMLIEHIIFPSPIGLTWILIKDSILSLSLLYLLLTKKEYKFNGKQFLIGLLVGFLSI